MNGKTPKSQRTREFIIETTAEIFERKGYAGTSISDLLKATNLSRGCIYGNFENKEEVALAAFDYNCNRIIQVLAKININSKTNYDRLLAYTQIYEQFLESTFPFGGCPILNAAIEADDTNGLLKERASSAIIKWQQNLQALIRAGIAAGEFKKDTDVGRMASSIISLIEGGVMIAKATGNYSSLADVMLTAKMLLGQMKV